jgi:preprotein translocase subunit SecD
LVQKNTSVALLLTLFILVGLGGYSAYHYMKGKIDLGMDLQGGLHVVMQAQESQGKPVTTDTIQKAVAIMKDRVDSLGVKETDVYSQGKDRVVIDIAGETDPEQAINILGKTAQLEFKDESGQTLLTGEHLVEAKAGANPSGDGSFVVNLEFDKTGAELFKQATTTNLNKPLVIVLDNEQISAPRVNTVIADGKCYIESFDATTANQLAVQLRSGALPVSLTLMEKRTVGPKLGADSLDSSVKAGLIGIIAILVFMLGYYRLPGLVADISMVLYSIIVLGTMAILGAVLTLPGIAGFVLSIGMAVDANVIIYERIKEELRLGKTIHAGIDAGFKRAFWTVFDANLTTLFTALILMYFGTGAVKGFAVTLTIGLVASMLVALTFTRYMLVLFAHVTDNKKLFGV